MRKPIITAILLFLGWTSVFAQNKKLIDSLHRRLATAKDAISRIHAQIELSSTYRLGKTDSSIFYGQQALQSARENNYPVGEILALSFMGITLEQSGNLAQALEMLFRALRIAQEHNLEQYTSPALNAIGETYLILKDYPKALYYLERQKKIYESFEINEGFGYALYDIGNVYEEMNQLDSAFHYEFQALEFFRKINREEPFVYRTLGNIEMKSGNRDKALSYYRQSLKIAIDNNEYRASAIAYNRIAFFYKTLDQPDSGIYYARKGLEEARLISHKKTTLEAATLLSELYEQTDAKESLRYLKIADAFKDSLFGTGNLQAIQTLVAQDEQYRKEIETAKMKYRNQLKQYGFIGGLAILLLIAAILYRNNRQKQKANKVLESTLFDLRSTQSQLIQSEKMASLGELTAGIAHEIQNPLNFVNNFAEVNKELIEELKSEKSKVKSERNEEFENQLLGDIEQNLEKINHHGKRAEAIVKGMLQHSRSGSGAKEPTDINALAEEYLRLAYHGLRAKDNFFNATIKTDFDDSIGIINIVPQDIGRVILNLITNAFYAVTEKKKHASTSSAGQPYEPTVSISTKKMNGKSDSYRIEIKVSDNGNGIPQQILDKIFQPFFTTKPTGQGTGLGLSLAYDIVKVHGGEIKVETKEGQGTDFIIHLPIL